MLFGTSFNRGPINVDDSRQSISQKKTIVAEWDKVPHRLVDRGIGQWRRRFRCVIQQQDGHIGNYFDVKTVNM